MLLPERLGVRSKPGGQTGSDQTETRSVEEPNKSSYNAPRRQCRNRRHSLVARTRKNARFCPRRRADQNRLRHGIDRPACAQRPTGVARRPNLWPRNIGSLTLNADGGFIYAPNAYFSGTDSFQYEANDGTPDSNVATATIQVQHVSRPFRPRELPGRRPEC